MWLNRGDFAEIYSGRFCIVEQSIVERTRHMGIIKEWPIVTGTVAEKITKTKGNSLST